MGRETKLEECGNDTEENGWVLAETLQCSKQLRDGALSAGKPIDHAKCEHSVGYE